MKAFVFMDNGSAGMVPSAVNVLSIGALVPPCRHDGRKQMARFTDDNLAELGEKNICNCKICSKRKQYSD